MKLEEIDYAGTPRANIECLVLHDCVRLIANEGNNERSVVDITKEEAIGMAKYMLKNCNYKTVVFKDGTSIETIGLTWEYENDPNWIITL